MLFGISGDTIEWRSVKRTGMFEILLIEPKTQIGTGTTALTDRHSGHHTQFRTEISKLSPEFMSEARAELEGL